MLQIGFGKNRITKKQSEINITLIDMEYDLTKTKAQLKTTSDSLTNANLLIEQLKPNPFKPEEPPHKYVSLQSLRNSSCFASYFGPGISAAECMNY